MHLVVSVAFYLLSSRLVLFTSSLLTRGKGMGREERRGGEGRRISAASVPGVLYRPQQTQEWLREKRTGKKPIRTCLSSSLSISISPSSLSIQRPAFNHVCVRLADTRGRTLRWVLVVHGPGRCFAVISWHLLIRLYSHDVDDFCSHVATKQIKSLLKLFCVCTGQFNSTMQMSTKWVNNVSNDPHSFIECVFSSDVQISKHQTWY